MLSITSLACEMSATVWYHRKGKGIPKNIYFCFTDYVKTFDSVDNNELWNILKDMGMPDHPTWLLETCMQDKKQQLVLDMEQ